MAISVIAAIIAGVLSFLSPCVLPLVPAFLAYLSGTSIDAQGTARLRFFLHSVVYVLGFASVFALLGVLFNTVLAQSSYTVQIWLGRVGGTIIILFGIYLIGLIRIPWLMREKRFEPKKLKWQYATSFLFGASFAVGWTPCVGAVLGSILALAVSQPGMSFALLFAYSLGLGIPFLIVGLLSSQALAWIRKFSKAMRWISIIAGIFLIIIGILVFTQTLGIIANIGFAQVIFS